MIASKRVVAVVPARGGSKGIKKKNIYPVNGKPLIWYTLSEAQKSKYCDEIFISTDSAEIAEVAKQCGVDVPFLRPKSLATDTAKSIDVVLHALEALSMEGKCFDIVVLLQPTSPLRTVRDIDGALETFLRHGEKSLASVHEVKDSPILMRTIQSDGTMKKLLERSSTIRRQEMPKYYRINGAIYVNRADSLNADTSLNDNEIPFFMPEGRSLDIDCMEDIHEMIRRVRKE